MSRRDTRLTGLNPLSYMGVEPVASPNVIENNRPPLQHDRQFNIGDLWVDRSLSTPDLFMLVAKIDNRATWIKFATGNNIITEYVTDSGTATQVGGLITLTGKDSLRTIASGNTVSIDFRPLTQGHMLISNGTVMASGIITSPLGSIDVTLGDGTIDLSYPTVDGIHGDVGDAVRTGNLIKILGGTNMEVHALDKTAFVLTDSILVLPGTFTLASYPYGVVTSDADGLTYPTNGYDGQVIIGSTAGVPAWSYITSTGGSLNIAVTANEIDITNQALAGITEIDGDTGTATAISNNIKLVGGTNIVTAASSHTVTIDLKTDVTLSGTLTLYGPSQGIVQVNGSGQLVATKGTVNGRTLIGSTSALPVWGNITAGDSTITVTNTAYGIDLKAAASTGMSSINADTGTATPVGGIIMLAGGTNFNTVSGGPTSSQVKVNLDDDIVIAGTLTVSAGEYGVLTNNTAFVTRNSVINPSLPQTVVIGGATSVAFGFITSSRGTITISQTASPRTINLENAFTAYTPGTTSCLTCMSLSASAADLELGGTTPRKITLTYERFDPSNCWNGDRYTAKHDGKYNIQAAFNFNRAFDGPYDTEMRTQLVTSNRTYSLRRKQTLVKNSPTSGSYLNGGMTIDVCCDMDTGDTASLYVSASFDGTLYFWKLAKGDGTFLSAFYVGR